MATTKSFDIENASLEDVKARIEALNQELSALRTRRNILSAETSGTKSRMYTVEEVQQIRERHAAGESYKKLWEAFGQRGTPGLIHDICAFKTYRDVS